MTEKNAGVYNKSTVINGRMEKGRCPVSGRNGSTKEEWERK